MSTHAGQSREAIRQAAAATFCEYGYRATTLEQIGARVGLTRGTVLHHYSTKARLLSAVVDPYLAELDHLLVRPGVDDPPTSTLRRQVLTALADLFVAHDAAVRLVTTDITARAQVRFAEQWAHQRQRLVVLLVGTRTAEPDRVRVSAALGAMLLPVASGELDLSDCTARQELVESAIAVLERPGTPTGPVTARAEAQR